MNGSISDLQGAGRHHFSTTFDLTWLQILHAVGKSHVTSLFFPLVLLLMTWLLCGEPLSTTATCPSAGSRGSSASLVSITAWGPSALPALVNSCHAKCPTRKTRLVSISAFILRRPWCVHGTLEAEADGLSLFS